jgi:hypothetical protein
VGGVRNLAQNATEDALENCDEEKEIKVKIPVEYHVKLHTLKVLKGQNISSTVEEALTRYFDILSENPEGKRLEKLSNMTVESLM